MLQRDLVLKHNELYLVGESQSNGSEERAAGLYVRDTRFLDYWRLRLDDVPLEPLDDRVLGADRAVIVTANGALPPAGPGRPEPVLPLTISVEQEIRLSTELRVRIALGNYSGRALPLTLSLALGADFRDLFDIRGFPRRQRGGFFTPPRWSGERLTLGYTDQSGATARLLVHFSRPPSFDSVTAAHEPPAHQPTVLLPGFDEVAAAPPLPPPPRATAYFHLMLEPNATWDLLVTLTPVPVGGPPIAATDAALHHERERDVARIATDQRELDAIFDRAAADLEMLQTSFPEGRLTAAGIPWFVAPFGRDSLIASLQTLHIAPQRAAETLRTLATLQGQAVDPFREEEPGKILHEVRYGEMARLREIPHTPYFGSVDATPLFVMLFAATVRWTADESLFHALLPHVRRALEWIERWGDRDGDLLVEYTTLAPDATHIVHQGWKDSFDSLHDLAGNPITGAIALVEVQGYVYAAYRWLADIVALYGDPGWAVALRERAWQVQRRVEEWFWLPDQGYYAQALDSEKRPVAAIASNPGHLLFCRLPTPDRARAMATRLRRPDLDSGWGVRTLATDMAAYNPMSYHNGSVWPHDNSLIAAGLGMYGESGGLARIASTLFAAAARMPLQRLPELYCGFARDESAAADAPVEYPVGCSPQAWAAGAVQLLVRAMLGLETDPCRGVLRVSPALPAWLPRLRLEGLTALGRTFDLDVERDTLGYRVVSDGPIEVIDATSDIGPG